MILIGLGANLEGKHGSPDDALRACPGLLAARGIEVVKSSHIWASAPVPISDQPWYKNAVCAIETLLSPEQVLVALSEIEAEMGRVRNIQNEARVLDLDLLCYHNKIIDTVRLKIPHERMHQRAFVLYPLQEVAPFWIHPVLDKSVDSLIKTLPDGQKIKRIEHSCLPSTSLENAA